MTVAEEGAFYTPVVSSQNESRVLVEWMCEVSRLASLEQTTPVTGGAARIGLRTISFWEPGRANGEARIHNPCTSEFDEAGLKDPPLPPFGQAIGGWILGSDGFVARLRTLTGATPSKAPVAEARQLGS